MLQSLHYIYSRVSWNTIRRLVNPNNHTITAPNGLYAAGPRDRALGHRVRTTAGPITIYPNTAFPNSIRRSIPHNVQEILIAYRLRLYNSVTRQTDECRLWNALLKKKCRALKQIRGKRGFSKLSGRSLVSRLSGGSRDEPLDTDVLLQ